jgi:hypothetical protein
VTTDLNTFATALYVKIDDWLKDSPWLAPRRPAVGFAPKLSDAELVTLAVIQALLSFPSERRWLRHAVPAVEFHRYGPGGRVAVWLISPG